MDIELVYQQHRHAIWRFLLSRLHDPDLADDLLSQVFECACRDADTYQDRGFSVVAWLLAIARW